MKIAVFGATGKTGRLFVAQALEAGHELTVLVRNAKKLAIEHRKLKVLEGDAREFGAVERTVHRADAVVSALGHGDLFPSTILRDATANILMAMERAGVKRIVVVGSAGTMGEAGLYGVIIGIVVASSQRDHARVLSLLREGDLEWTVVRARVLTNGARRGTYRIERQGVVKRGFFISRADVAHFMLRCLTGKRYVRGAPAIAY